jgi:hypothetical protein
MGSPPTKTSGDSHVQGVYRIGPKPTTPPAYSTGVSFGNLLFFPGLFAASPVTSKRTRSSPSVKLRSN